ncbi:MAG: toxin-antitoxin system YwqK family antitoxin [Bacteroidia bacterium]
MKFLRYSISIFLLLSSYASFSQTFEIQDGDTINMTLANGKKHGFWRYFWANGDLKYEVYYDNGEKEGLEIKYYDVQDCIEFSNTYQKGTLNGPSLTFFPNCSTRTEEIYVNGQKNGYERNYDQGGFLLTEGQFSKGELVGSYAHFDKKGIVTYESPTKETTLKFDKFLTGEYKIRDSTIFKVFQRNTQWKKVLLVVDMTGSMFPYIGQLLVWFKNTFEDGKIKYYTLFNDGDNLADEKKVVGRTGGVHSYEAKDYKKLKKDIEDVRKLGEGGDDPENDLEAITTSMINYRDYADIVLLADDSQVRDMALLKRIRKPVHVILCGTKKGVNDQYLKIAYQTKGSIHTLNTDVDMKKIKDGDEVIIEKDIFKFKNGQFEWVDVMD